MKNNAPLRSGGCEDKTSAIEVKISLVAGIDHMQYASTGASAAFSVLEFLLELQRPVLEHLPTLQLPVIGSPLVQLEPVLESPDLHPHHCGASALCMTQSQLLLRWRFLPAPVVDYLLITWSASAPGSGGTRLPDCHHEGDLRCGTGRQRAVRADMLIQSVCPVALP